MKLCTDTNRFRRIASFCSALAFACLLSLPAIGQEGGGEGGGEGGLGGFFPPPAGVDVDAAGVLRSRTVDPRLAQQRWMEARQRANADDVMRPSKLRKVSLNRLEAAVAERISAGAPLSDEQVAMAGLTSVEYVFYYPDTKDIVLAGPAEGFVADGSDRFVGLQTRKPTLLLEDVVVALRAFGPDGAPTPVISVSIDPTQEGLQRMQQFLQAVGGRAGRGDTARLVQGLKNNLGLQNVSITGIPAATHFACVLVEADYRMKMIGIGLEQLPVPFKSYVARTTPANGGNAMQRWYFQPNYEGVSVSEDRLAMRLKGSGVELVGEGERVMNDGQRVAAGRTNRASQGFCNDFTEKYDLIADRVLVYAELRQLIDLAISAAYIQEQDFYGQAEWSMPVLGDERKLPVERYTAPEKVETAVNAIWRGNTLMTPLGGGVQVQPGLALRSDRVEVDASGDHKQALTTAGPNDLQPGQWWWD